MCSSTGAPHVYRGGLDEDSVGVDVVVEDDDADHDPHAEQEGVLAAETTRILPKRKTKKSKQNVLKGFKTSLYKKQTFSLCSCDLGLY